MTAARMTITNEYFSSVFGSPLFTLIRCSASAGGLAKRIIVISEEGKLGLTNYVSLPQFCTRSHQVSLVLVTQKLQSLNFFLESNIFIIVGNQDGISNGPNICLNLIIFDNASLAHRRSHHFRHLYCIRNSLGGLIVRFAMEIIFSNSLDQAQLLLVVMLKGHLTLELVQ